MGYGTPVPVAYIADVMFSLGYNLDGVTVNEGRHRPRKERYEHLLHSCGAGTESENDKRDQTAIHISNGYVERRELSVLDGSSG